MLFGVTTVRTFCYRSVAGYENPSRSDLELTSPMRRPPTSAPPPPPRRSRVGALARGVARPWAVVCPLSFACLLGTVGFVAGAFFAEAPVVAEAPIPSWKRGVPTWDGERYVAPPINPPVPMGGWPMGGGPSGGGSTALGSTGRSGATDTSGATGTSGATPAPRSTREPMRNPVYHVPVDSSGNRVGSAKTADPAAWDDPAAWGKPAGATGSSSLRLHSPAGTAPPGSLPIGPLPAPRADTADENPVPPSGLADLAAERVPAGDASPPAEAILPGEADLDGQSDLDGEAARSLGERLEAGVTEEPPLEEDVLRWYEYPIRWLSKGWKNHAEFGINGTEGNARTLAIQTGLELKRKTELDTFAIDFDYRQARNRNSTTENNGRLNVDYDRMVGESSWSMFSKFGIEWDEFKAFDLRVNLNGGVGYHWLRDEQTTLVTRFGAGASRPFGSPIDRWTQEAVFGIDLEHQLTERQKIKGKVDYFPAWSDFSRFRLVSDISWEVLLDGSENLSLKVGVTDRYDSDPQGARPNDVYYSMLLLYKF